MTLLIILTIFSQTAKTNDQFEELTPVEDGFIISHEGIIDLSNYIQELEAEIDLYQERYNATLQALETERKQTDELLETKNQVIEAQSMEITAKDELIDNLELETQLKSAQIQNYEELREQEQLQNRLIGFGIGFAGGTVATLLMVTLIMN